MRRSARRRPRSTACCSGPARSSTRCSRARTTSVAAPESPEAQDQLAQYIAAFETYDMDKLVELFTEDAVFEMPPFDGWYQGPEDIVTLSKTHCPAEGPGDMRFVRDHRQRPARRRAVHAQPRDGRARGVPAARPRGPPGGVSHVVAFHAATGCSRSSGCPPRSDRSAKWPRFADVFSALSLQKSPFATAEVRNEPLARPYLQYETIIDTCSVTCSMIAVMKTKGALLWELNSPFGSTRSTRRPVADEVQIRMHAAGMCHSDYHLTTGATPIALPALGGHEGAGVSPRSARTSPAWPRATTSSSRSSRPAASARRA